MLEWTAVLITFHPCSYLEQAVESGEVSLLPWRAEAMDAVTTTYPERTIASQLPADTYDEGQPQRLLGYAPSEPDIRTPIDPIDFGDVAVGGGTDDFTPVRNDGATLTINSVTRTAGSTDFSYVGDALPWQIPPGYSWRLVVRFAPTSVGPKTATFTVNSNDPDTSNVTFDVSGNGVEPQITGTTGEVNCDTLPETTVEAYQGVELKGSTVSDGSGNYTLSVPETGDYDIVASKTGSKDKTQSITISDTTYPLDFVGEHGLIPNAPSMSYVLECINHWLYPAAPCGLSMSKVLAVINAWLYPI